MTEIKGILGEKLGMTQIFQDTRAIPVTVIQAGPCVVAQVKTKANDGYDAVQLVFGATRPRSVTKPMQGHFDKNDAEPGRHVVELRTEDASSYEPGQEIRVDLFQPGDLVDAVGVSKGKGVLRTDEAARVRGTGRIPRHPAQASLARFHRSLRHPSRVFKGHAHGRPPRELARHRAEP